MADITGNSLRGIVKTLNDVVVPAIPADDPLALQELKMVVRYLGFCRVRVDHLYARSRYELEFYCGLLNRCAGLLQPGHADMADECTGLASQATALLAQPGAAIGSIRALAQQIMSRVSQLVADTQADPQTQALLERGIVKSSAEITAFDRAWYLPLKLERFPDQVRPLASFIPIHEPGPERAA